MEFGNRGFCTRTFYTNSFHFGRKERISYLFQWFILGLRSVNFINCLIHFSDLLQSQTQSARHCSRHISIYHGVYTFPLFFKYYFPFLLVTRNKLFCTPFCLFVTVFLVKTMSTASSPLPGSGPGGPPCGGTPMCFDPSKKYSDVSEISPVANFVNVSSLRLP